MDIKKDFYTYILRTHVVFFIPIRECTLILEEKIISICIVVTVVDRLVYLEYEQVSWGQDCELAQIL